MIQIYIIYLIFICINNILTMPLKDMNTISIVFLMKLRL